MKMEIKKEKENPYLKRKEYEIEIEHSGEATPSKAALQQLFSKENRTELTKTDVVNIFSKFGSNISKGKVYVWKEKEVEDLSKKKEEEKGKEKKEKGEEKETEKKKEEKKEEKAEEKSKKTKEEKQKNKDTKEGEGEEEEEEAKEEKDEGKKEGKPGEKKVKPKKEKPTKGKKKEKEEKKKKSGTKKEGKKPRSKSKHNNVQIWKKYEVKNGKVKRKSDFCHRCGDGTFIAEYKNRKYCGKCGWGQIGKSGSDKK